METQGIRVVLCLSRGITLEEAIQGPLLCTSGKLSECLGAAISCMDVCSRAGGCSIPRRMLLCSEIWEVEARI